jgi:hypothetical protein
VTDEEAPTGRPWLSLYAAAFVLVVVGGIALVVSVRGFLASATLLYLSAACSALAVGLAVASLVVRKRP